MWLCAQAGSVPTGRSCGVNPCRVPASRARAASPVWPPVARPLPSMLTCVDARSIRSPFETSDLRPDESTTNIGLFQGGGLRARVRRKLSLTLFGPDAKASRPAPTPHRGPSSWDTDCAPRPAGRFTPGTLQGRLIELTELGLRHRSSTSGIRVRNGLGRPGAWKKGNARPRCTTLQSGTAMPG